MTAKHTPLPDLPPPIATVGVLGWLRRNLFSSPLNAALTLLAIYLVYIIIPPIIQWAFVNANWIGTSREDCTGTGACWVFVRVRFDQFMYGFYPEAERWRVNAAFLLLVIAAIPLFIASYLKNYG